MERADQQDKFFKEAQQYDKILRENMEAALPGIIESVLHIHAVQSEELPDTLQHTKEREPDVLKKVTDQTGNTFVLHVEFQVTNEAIMPFRMADYWVMLLRNYRLPVKQHVIYIGREKLTMGNVLKDGYNFFTYNLIDISKIDYKVFLRADVVEEKMLAILGNYGTDVAETVITDVITDVLQNTPGQLEK